MLDKRNRLGKIQNNSNNQGLYIHAQKNILICIKYSEIMHLNLFKYVSYTYYQNMHLIKKISFQVPRY